MKNVDIPNIAVMSSMKEYKFAKELLETYESEDKIKSHNIMYISAWILGISVGNYEEDTEDKDVISKIVNKMMTKFGYLSGVYYISQEKYLNNYILILDQHTIDFYLNYLSIIRFVKK